MLLTSQSLGTLSEPGCRPAARLYEAAEWPESDPGIGIPVPLSPELKASFRRLSSPQNLPLSPNVYTHLFMKFY